MYPVKLAIDGMTKVTSKEINILYVENYLRNHQNCLNSTIFLADLSIYTNFLGAAAWNGDYYLMNYLISLNADINGEIISSGETALYIAAQKGNLEMFKFLKKKGGDINKKAFHNASLLMKAVKYGRYSIAKYLIEEGADVNASENLNGSRPLHLAACGSNGEMVKLLLDNNAEIDAEDYRGMTPLREAFVNCGMNIIQFLIAKGADINKINKLKGGSPIMHDVLYACRYRPNSNNEGYWVFTAVLKCFLTLDEPFADINILDGKRETLLYYATYRGGGIVELLLDAGIDVNSEKSVGKSVINCEKRVNFDGDAEIETVKQHIVKLISAGLTVSGINRQAVKNNFEDLRKLCHKELEKMKMNKIGGSNVTFFTVLPINFHNLAVRLKLVDLDGVIDKEKLRSKYPLYGGMLYYKLSKVNRRINYLVEAEKLIEEIMCKSGLPFDFVRELWNYFTNIELKKLVFGNKVNTDPILQFR